MKKLSKIFSLVLICAIVLSMLASCVLRIDNPDDIKSPSDLIDAIFGTDENTTDKVTEKAPADTNKNTDAVDVSELRHTLFDGKNAFIVLNNNVPFFTDDEITATSYEEYGALDEFDRCTTCIACVGKDLMPTDERESISSVYPSGWKYNGKSNNNQYDFVDGNYIYNRCHLIGFQLTGENANEQNLITGTRYLNIDGMLSFENMIADAVREGNMHVMYRVTPIYEGNNPIAEGLVLEGYSVEDNGETVQFCVFSPNVQPGVEINYATGENREA